MLLKILKSVLFSFFFFCEMAYSFADYTLYNTVISPSYPSIENGINRGILIETNPDIKQANVNDSVSFFISNASYNIIIKAKINHKNGDITLVGREVGQQNNTVITIGKNGVFASLKTVDGEYRIIINNQVEWLQSPEFLSSLPPALQFQDGIPLPESVQAQSGRSRSDGFIKDAPDGVANIDVMVLYTQELIDRMGDVSFVETRINYLVSLVNQAYFESEMSISLALVHSELIGASNTADSLSNLTNGVGVFAGVDALRSSKGADFVVLLKDFVNAHSYCGVAWLLGDKDTGTMPNYHRSHAYGVVHDGSRIDAYCHDYTLAHELGHNFGFAHDIEHTTGSGLFDYSYGHDSLGTFATIMSYDNPQIGKFSNPNVLCDGLACGIYGVADNARSGNNVRHDLAAFTATVALLPNVSLTGVDLTAEEGSSDTGSVLISRTGGNISSALSVNFVVSGTATNGVDYTLQIGGAELASDAVMIPAGENSVELIIIPSGDDGVLESLETMIITLSGGSSSYQVNIINNSALVNITDSSGTVILGDANNDGVVNIQDVVSVINIILTGGGVINGVDCNEDGLVNIQDVVCVINIILNL